MADFAMTEQLKLVRPHVQWEYSFRTGFDELTSASDQSAWIYLGEEAYASYFQMPFSIYVDTLLKREFEPPKNFVCDTVYWAIFNDDVVGRISLRHQLNDFLKVEGGHIGYITRPSARNKGVATKMLQQILATDKARSISDLLLTCDECNIASEKIMLRAGGVLENIVDLGLNRPRKKQFWIRLRSNAH